MIVEVPDSLLREALPLRSYQLWKHLQGFQLTRGVGTPWFLNISTINQNNFCRAVRKMDRNVFRRCVYKWKKHLIEAGLLENVKRVGGRNRGWRVIVHGQSKIGGHVLVPQATYEKILAKKERIRQAKSTSANLLHKKMAGEVAGNAQLYLAKLVSTESSEYIKLGVTSRPLNQRWSPTTPTKWHNIRATLHPIYTYEMPCSEAYKAEQWILEQMNKLNIVPAMGDETYDLCHLRTLTELYGKMTLGTKNIGINAYGKDTQNEGELYGKDTQNEGELYGKDTQNEGELYGKMTLGTKNIGINACGKMTPSYTLNILNNSLDEHLHVGAPSEHPAAFAASEEGLGMTKEEWLTQFSDEEGTAACFIKQDEIPERYKLEAQRFRLWFTNPLRFYSKNGGFRINRVRSPDPPMLDPKLSRDEKVHQLKVWCNNAGDHFWGPKTRWYLPKVTLKKESIDQAIEIFHKHEISPVKWCIAYFRYLQDQGTKYTKKRPYMHTVLCGPSILQGTRRNRILTQYGYGIEHGIRGLALGQTPTLDDLLKRWGNMQVEPLFVKQDLTDRVLAGIVWDYFHADDATPNEVIKNMLVKSEMEAKSKQSYINELARDGYNVWEVVGVSNGQD